MQIDKDSGSSEPWPLAVLVPLKQTALEKLFCQSGTKIDTGAILPHSTWKADPAEEINGPIGTGQV